LQHAQVDPFVGSAVRAAAEKLGPQGGHDEKDETDELLNLLLATLVEPHLGAERPELVYHYPATQCALATTTTDDEGHEIAERFELYYRGVELANGYRELTDPVELRRRLEQATRGRIADGRQALPMPEALLADMRSPGLPPSAGVALGFDRLLMLAVGAKSIEEVSPP
jgi:lysyl-tRNA synthetase class 2